MRIRKIGQRRERFFESLENRRMLAVVGNNLSVGDELQVYRLAIAATAEYTAMFADADAAFESIETLVADLNSIYTPELAIHFDLVSDVTVVFTDGATDGYHNDLPSLMLDENRNVLNGSVGSENYDIGHVLGYVASGAAGLATLKSVGKTAPNSSHKARGVSAVSSPAAEWVSLVAHEIGHQFGADHTFNGADGSCTAANWASSSANEPGSGSSIMSYFSSCGADNLPDFEDLMFHATSYEEIQTYIATTPVAAPNSTPSLNNTPPTVGAGPNYIIPAETPFELTAIGTDVDLGDPIRYSWEQIDRWQQQNIGSSWTDDGQSPLFRSYSPVLSPLRTFPRLSDLLANADPRDNGELLPMTNRDLNFRVTVRDGKGGVSSDDMRVEVRDTGAAFAVSAPNTAVTWSGGSQQTISWNVAGTDANDINVTDVEILLSIDGGLSFPLSLATTANDGAEIVTIPNIATSQARIKVRAVNNVFFDLSNENFIITSAASLAGLTVTPGAEWGELTEGGAAKTYSVQLKTDPLGVVRLQVGGSPDTVVSLDGRQFSEFVGLDLNSTASQMVFVRASVDAQTEGPVNRTLLHTVVDSTSGDYPIDAVLTPISTYITDRQLPPVIGLDFDFTTSSGSPKNWTTGRLTGLVTSFSNLRRDDGLPTSVDLSVALDGAGSIGAGFDHINHGTRPDHVPSLDGLHGYNRSSRALTATWSSLVPGQSYGVFVFGSVHDSLNVSQTITLTGEVGSTTSFVQTLVGGVLMVNDENGDRTRSLESYEESIVADATGKITVNVAPTGATTWVSLAGLAIRKLPIDDRAVVGRQLFYNDSAFDGNDAAAAATDDGAIAADKSPLFQGSATFANYSSYAKGINGILVDIMSVAGALGPSDFAFHVGNHSGINTWTTAPTPSVTVRDGEGVGGSDRVTLTWQAGEIVDNWLRVTVKSSMSSGLKDDDLFFFGNLVGDTGNSTSNAAADLADAQLLFGALGGAANLTSPLDIDRDGLITLSDVQSVSGPPFRAIELIAILNNSVASGRRAAPVAIEQPVVIDRLVAVERAAGSVPPVTTDADDAAAGTLPQTPTRLDKAAIDHLLGKSNQWLSRRRAYV